MSRRLRPVIAVIIILLAAGAWWLLRSRNTGGGLEATGTVEATEAELGFTVPGRVMAVRVDEGDTVSAGDTLAWLDRTETRARRDQADAQVAATRAQLLELERGSRPEAIAQARAASQVATDELAQARRNAERARELRKQNVIAQADLDDAETALRVASGKLDQAQEAQREVEKGPREEDVATARAELTAAVAAVRTLDATLSQMEVRAPFAGVITVRHHHPGEILGAGVPVVSLLDRDHRWVRIYVPEDRIGALRLGQNASITSDTFRGRRYPGTVSAISSEAEFTPKTVQTREERVKLVYAVKVRITGDREYQLKPGMPVDVVLEGGAK